MFDDSFTRSELYFKTLQLLRTFSEWTSDSLASIDHLRMFFLPFLKDPTATGFVSESDDDDEEEEERHGTNNPHDGGGTSNAAGSQTGSDTLGGLTSEDLNTMEKNWAATSGFLKAAEARLQERISRKTEEVKSLRDGVSSSPFAPLTQKTYPGGLTERIPSFSMPRHFGKLPGGSCSTSTSWSSPS